MNAIDFYPNIIMPRPSKSAVGRIIATVNHMSSSSSFTPQCTSSISSSNSCLPPFSVVTMTVRCDTTAAATNFGDLEAVFREKRSLSYYDLFPKKYQSLAKEMIWKPPLHDHRRRICPYHSRRCSNGCHFLPFRFHFHHYRQKKMNLYTRIGSLDNLCPY
ncbi:hypothetical protein LINGRAHAP2_LOCUS34940 [Linum grandiflorum]